MDAGILLKSRWLAGAFGLFEVFKMTPEEAIKIIEEAEWIKSRIKDEFIYDTRIDTENLSHLIVVAYRLGLMDGGQNVSPRVETVV